MRSCYSSQWRLFSDAEDTLVAGRYYFAPAGTPFYPGAHLLGSRVWDPYTVDDGEGEGPDTLPPSLGESRTAAHRWDTGALPPAIAQPIAVGTSSCLEAGEPLSEGLDQADQVNGYPAACFLPPAPPNPDFVFGFSIWRCDVQLFWARALYLVSYGFQADAVAWLSARFAGSAVITVAKSTAFPPYALVVHPSYCAAVLAGTSNLEQALVQAMNLVQAPADYGQFSTGTLWYNFATQILSALKAQGVTDARPLVVVGHSYGGASAMLVAVRAGLGSPGREIRYLTMGAPKPGDKRLAVLLDQAFDGLSLVNDGDLIAALPPDSGTIASLSQFLPIGLFTGWTQWLYPPESALLVGTRLVKNAHQVLDSAALYAFIVQIARTGTITTGTVHDIATYVGVIASRCPEQFPADVGNVLGLVASSPTRIGNVLGMVANPPVVTSCCESVPRSVALLCVAATDGYSSWAGQLGCLAYVGGALQLFEGAFPDGSNPPIAMTFYCNNDIEGFFWELSDSGFTLGGGTAPVGCPPILIDTRWSRPHGDGGAVFCIYSIGGCQMPTGAIFAWPASTLPAGCLACDGSAVSRSTYANLFGVIGTTYGAGDGSTTFNLPDLRDRTPIGVSPGGLGSDRPSSRVLSAVGGEEAHVLVIAELPAHNHPVSDPGHNHSFFNTFVTDDSSAGLWDNSSPFGGAEGAAETQNATTSISVGNTGGGGGHNTMQPFLTLIWVIQF